MKQRYTLKSGLPKHYENKILRIRAHGNTLNCCRKLLQALIKIIEKEQQHSNGFVEWKAAKKLVYGHVRRLRHWLSLLAEVGAVAFREGVGVTVREFASRGRGLRREAVAAWCDKRGVPQTYSYSPLSDLRENEAARRERERAEAALDRAAQDLGSGEALRGASRAGCCPADREALRGAPGGKLGLAAELGSASATAGSRRLRAPRRAPPPFFRRGFRRVFLRGFRRTLKSPGEPGLSVLSNFSLPISPPLSFSFSKKINYAVSPVKAGRGSEPDPEYGAREARLEALRRGVPPEDLPPLPAAPEEPTGLGGEPEPPPEQRPPAGQAPRSEARRAAQRSESRPTPRVPASRHATRPAARLRGNRRPASEGDFAQAARKLLPLFSADDPLAGDLLALQRKIESMARRDRWGNDELEYGWRAVLSQKTGRVAAPLGYLAGVVRTQREKRRGAAAAG